MKTLGLIGGTSWESTVEYYRILNREINIRLGGQHSCKLRLYSFDFDEIDLYYKTGNISRVGYRFIEESQILENAGVDAILLCANTAHMFAEEIRTKIKIPLIHIAEETGKAIRQTGLKKVVLLGTKYTMEGDFIIGPLNQGFGIEVLVPDSDVRNKINSIIFDELIHGIFNDTSKKYLIEIINKFENINGIILGCTELPLILKPEDTEKNLFDTTEIHAKAAVDFALS